MNAWNFANMKLVLLDDDSDNAINAIKNINTDLLKKMMDYKINHFSEYTNFIIGFDVKENKNGETVLTVTTQKQEVYLTDMLNAMENQDDEEEFDEEAEYDENYINRYAIIIKPLQPFLDWYSILHPFDHFEKIKEAKTYLINEENEDVEAWLKKKFDKIFMFELESHHTNKKEWPQNRNYKMFKEWFQIDISKLVFDLEKQPVFKL